MHPVEMTTSVPVSWARSWSVGSWSSRSACTASSMKPADRAYSRALIDTSTPIRHRVRTMSLIGVDVSIKALEYARSAGFIDDAVHADLEDQDPTDQERAQLTGTDVVISTGCIGYVTERTIA